MSSIRAQQTRKDVRVIFIPFHQILGLVENPVTDYEMVEAHVMSGTDDGGVYITLEGVIE